MRRVALVTTNYHPRICGVGDHSMRLAQALLARGEHPRVFATGAVEPNPAAPEVEVEGTERDRLPSLRAFGLARAVLRWRPEVVLLQYTAQMLEARRFGSASIPALAAALRAQGAHVTLVAHELYTPWRWRPDLAVGSVSHRAQLAALMQIAQRTVVTTESRVPLARSLALGREIAVVPVGANALPVARQRVPGRLRLGVFTTLAVGKRLDVVLGAFERVHAAHPHAELRLLGDLGAPGNPARRALEAQLAAHPAAARIRMPGALPLDAIAHEIAQLDVYLFPMNTGANTRSGTLPVPLGAGVPVVAIRERETSDWFQVDRNVVFARALEAGAFAEAALRLIENPALAETVAAGGARLYRERLAWDAIARTLVP